MSRAPHPLTPASSTDLIGEDGVNQLASIQMAFELPPPAIGNVKSGAMKGKVQAKATTCSTALSPDLLSSPKHSSRKTCYPLQASETVKSRPRSSVAQAQGASSAVGADGKKDTFALPPPPTRLRRIIQMKPKSAAAPRSNANDQPESTPTAKAKASKSTAESSDTGTWSAPEPAISCSATTKKKTPSAASAAGRKIARKTAHSLIERRRRSKMNEEFATLKDLIPACTGEMHKLAILQASIDYIRYLEDCVAKLQTQMEDHSMSMDLAPPPTTTSSYDDYEMEEEKEHDHTPTGAHNPYGNKRKVASSTYGSPVIETGSGSVVLSPTLTGQQVLHPQQYQNHHGTLQSQSIHSSSISPAIMAQDSPRRNSAYSSTSNAAAATLVTAEDGGHGGRHYSFVSVTSATLSPASEPPSYPESGYYSMSKPGFTLTSPALGPLRNEQEASAAALLMLNNDRRGSGTVNTGISTPSTGPPPVGMRGMSVRDLISS